MTTAKLSDTEYEIMRMLIQDRVRYGYEMGKRGLAIGSVYVLLGRLEDKGFVAGKFEVSGDQMPRKVYTATPMGKDVFNLWRQLRAVLQ